MAEWVRIERSAWQKLAADHNTLKNIVARLDRQLGPFDASRLAGRQMSILRAPSGGIPARVGFLPGKADCQVYRIGSGAGGSDRLYQVQPVRTVPAYNMKTDPVSGDDFVQAVWVEESGVWVVEGSCCVNSCACADCDNGAPERIGIRMNGVAAGQPGCTDWNGAEFCMDCCGECFWCATSEISGCEGPPCGVKWPGLYNMTLNGPISGSSCPTVGNHTLRQWDVPPVATCFDYGNFQNSAAADRYFILITGVDPGTGDAILTLEFKPAGIALARWQATAVGSADDCTVISGLNLPLVFDHGGDSCDFTGSSVTISAGAAQGPPGGVGYIAKLFATRSGNTINGEFQLLDSTDTNGVSFTGTMGSGRDCFSWTPANSTLTYDSDIGAGLPDCDWSGATVEVQSSCF